MKASALDWLRRTAGSRSHQFLTLDDRHEGQGLIEYGLVIIMVSIAAAGLQIYGIDLGSLYAQIVADLPF